MRLLSVGLAIAVLPILLISALTQGRGTTADLAFMTGCWKFEAKGRTVEEHWMAPAGGSLLGISRTVMSGKTTEFEFIQIRDLPEGLAYIAKPSNQPEAKFVVASRTSDEVVFENPEHDFPQRIRYRRASNGLHARIEGAVDGKTRSIEFPYTRTNCTP